MGELETDENERPHFPPRVVSATVPLNPFDDVIPRVTAAERRAVLERAKKAQDAEKTKKKGKSFAGEEEQEENGKEDKEFRIKSSHDVLVDDATLRPEPALELSKIEHEKKILERMKRKVRETESSELLGGKRGRSEQEIQAEINEFDERMKMGVRNTDVERGKEISYFSSVTVRVEKESETEGPVPSQLDAESKTTETKEEPKEEEPKKPKSKKARREAFESLKSEMGDMFATKYKPIAAPLRSKHGEDSKMLDQIKNFGTLVWNATQPKESEAVVEKKDPPCILHSVRNCESCNAELSNKKVKKIRIVGDAGDIIVEDAADSDNEADWWNHQLKFDKDDKGKDLMKRRDDIDDYVVIDPRVRKLQVERLEKEKRQEVPVLRNFHKEQAKLGGK